MFKELGKELVDLGKSLKESLFTPFDPSVFNHPVAMQTEWSPLKGGGANFRTHRIVCSSEKASFKPTLFNLFFDSLFFCGGLGVLILAFSPDYRADTDSGNIMVLVLMGLAFLCAGSFLLYLSLKPRVFDKQMGYYYKGYLRKGETPEYSSVSETCELLEIAGIQLISEYCSSSKSGFRSYETNLVLNDGDRLNVVDHGSRRHAIRDAQKLANFLNVPLWSTIQPANQLP